MYEELFSLRRDGHFLSDYYAVKGTLDELDFYQPLVLNLNVLQQYRDELVVVKFISELDKTKFEYKFLMVMSFFSQLLCPEFIVFL